MDDRISEYGPPNKSWDQYWRGIKNGATPNAGGAQHREFNRFWDRFFAELSSLPSPLRMVDIGSGDGAVAASALGILAKDAVQVSCIDISPYAVDTARRRFPAIHSIVADAARVPLRDFACDVVTSQFGVEYAVNGFVEATRLVCPGGRLGLLIHHRNGAVHRECSANLDAVNGLRDCEFVPRAAAVLRAGFAACRGGDPEPYRLAAGPLMSAYRELEKIMEHHGSQVAGGTLVRLYEDVDRIHQALERYDPSEVLGWLSRLDGELVDYALMMQSMCEAALDEPQFHAVCDQLNSAGLELLNAAALEGRDQSLPLAWAITAVRPPTS